MGPLTYADYAAMPDDGRRYELIDGELIMTPAPGIGISGWSGTSRYSAWHVAERQLGLVLFAPLDVILSEQEHGPTGRTCTWIARKCRDAKPRHRSIPTLLVEVISPTRRTSIDAQRRSFTRDNDGGPNRLDRGSGGSPPRGDGARRARLRKGGRASLVAAVAMLEPFPKLAIQLAPPGRQACPTEADRGLQPGVTK